MKAFRTSTAILFMAIFALAAAAQDKHKSPNGAAPSGPAPLLVIESFTHDFGEVKAGVPLRHTFKVKNNGNADLLIHSVAPG